MNYFILFLGVVIHFLIKISIAKKKQKTGFELKIWFKKNNIYVLTSLLSAVAISLIIDTSATMKLTIYFVTLDYAKAVYLGIGLLNASLIKNVTDLFKKKK